MQHTHAFAYYTFLHFQTWNGNRPSPMLMAKNLKMNQASGMRTIRKKAQLFAKMEDLVSAVRDAPRMQKEQD